MYTLMSTAVAVSLKLGAGRRTCVRFGYLPASLTHTLKNVIADARCTVNRKMEFSTSFALSFVAKPIGVRHRAHIFTLNQINLTVGQPKTANFFEVFKAATKAPCVSGEA